MLPTRGGCKYNFGEAYLHPYVTTIQKLPTNEL